MSIKFNNCGAAAMDITARNEIVNGTGTLRIRMGSSADNGSRLISTFGTQTAVSAVSISEIFTEEQPKHSAKLPFFFAAVAAFLTVITFMIISIIGAESISGSEMEEPSEKAVCIALSATKEESTGSHISDDVKEKLIESLDRIENSRA